MNEYIISAITALTALAIGVILFKIFIPILRKVKLGQKILEIGPSWHKVKEGTPNLGGVIFIVACIIAIAVGALIYRFSGSMNEGSTEDPFHDITDMLLCVMMLPLLNGLIGFIDDYIKLFKKRNKGLSAIQKLILQFLAAAGYLYFMNYRIGIGTAIDFPWGAKLELGWFYYVLMLLAIVYIINCANLTDGIDGLAGSIAMIDCVMLYIFFLLNKEVFYSTYIFVAALIGALLAFLIFNFHPAKIFMGDTGSLFLGGFIVSLIMMTGFEFLLLPVSFIWIIEGLSVVLQVASFKLTGKRIFKMSPIHHHFEKCGWSEVKIVAVFSAFTTAFAFLTYYLLT
ncbi:MAG: phospho-N-acetylmuramoyl-pentapeptide-transferase [Clostridia bacterium]|nr:phospho-N-acetylmuramoyl-pentapeptide-transferase [Clostridia bacterium]